MDKSAEVQYYDKHLERIDTALQKLSELESVEAKEPSAPTTETKPDEPFHEHQKGKACIPCAINHFSTCAGLISDEAIRMAKRGRISKEEIIRRISRCQDQLNAMEREDLAVEKLQALEPWEREIAIYTQTESAKIRHELEGLSSTDDLEPIALRIREIREKIGKDYFTQRLKGE